MKMRKLKQETGKTQRETEEPCIKRKSNRNPNYKKVKRKKLNNVV